MAITPTIQLYMGAGAGTEITSHTNVGVGTATGSYGIRGSGPLDRMASTGTFSWSMKNYDPADPDNTIGYYTPGHTNVRSGWDLGTRIRLRISSGGDDENKFIGTLISVKPEPGEYRRRVVRCVAADWIDDAARAKVVGVPIQEGQPSDAIVQTLVGVVDKAPESTSYAAGSSAFTLALDNIDEERDTVYGALSKVVRSEVGYLYVKGNGQLTFESRHTRVGTADPSAGNTFTNSMTGLDVTYDRTTVINRAHVTVHPRKTSASLEVLFSLDPTGTTPAVGPGGASFTLTGLLRSAGGQFVRVGGLGIIDPLVSGTDFVANSSADGTGEDLTSDVTAVVSVQSNSVVFTLTNNNATKTAYFSTLQVRGYGVQDTYQTVMTSDDATSISAYGEIVIRYDIPYEENLEFGQALADLIVDGRKDPQYFPVMTISANTNTTLMTAAITLEPGDKIRITETVTGLASDDYFINGVNYTIRPANQLDVTYILAPLPVITQSWILGTDAFGSGNTTLGSI